MIQASAQAAVYNVPPDPPPASLQAGDTLNLGVGGVIGNGFDAALGSTMNVNGGSIGFFAETAGVVNLNSGQFGSGFRSLPGSEVNIYGGALGFLPFNDHAQWTVYGGQVGDAANLNGGKLSIQGGKVGDITAIQHSEIFISAGQLGRSINPISQSTLTMTGGVLTNGFTFGEESTWTLSGGVVNGTVEISTFNILCKTVLVGGAPIAGLIPGVPHLVTQRNVKLTGVLLDGSPFDFDMNSGPGDSSVDRFPVQATVTVTVVPEPSHIAFGGIFASLALLPYRRLFSASRRL
jgi:hypothetical protein